MNKSLKALPQYHFDRSDFCKVIEQVFTWEEFVDVDVECSCNRHYDDFSLFRVDDEFYILHRDSGTLINWYKHAGRTNTCNNPNFTLEDFKEFLIELRKELVWEKVIRDDALLAKLQKEYWGLEE